MPVLRVGSTGELVRELQRLLNERLSPSPGLPVSGTFDGRTRDAVLRFQRANWLWDDGVAGDATFAALRGTETYQVLHRVNLVPQPTAMTCWAASTAMILGRSTVVTAPPFMLNAAGALLNDSALNDAAITRQFVAHYNLHLYYPQTWTPAGLAGVLRRGPVMCNVLWNVADYTAGRGSDSHWVVFAGIRGDGTADGTTLRIYDPLPQGRGSIFSRNYGWLLQRLPALTYQMFQR